MIDHMEWIRSAILMLVIGCVGAGDPDGVATTVAASSPVRFHCLNHTSIHVVTCDGSISLFPITIEIDSLRILSDNEITILSGDLDDLAVGDGDIVDDNRILSDARAVVLDDLLDRFQIAVTGNDVSVCTTATGHQACL